MTKSKRIITTILSMIICLSALLIAAPTALAAKNDLLLVEDVVLVDDAHLIVKFNKPVAFNIKGDNRGPWIALRIVDDANNYLVADNGSMVLQWTCLTEFTDDKHDTLVMTYDLDGSTMKDFVNFGGLWREHYKEGRHARLCIEEVPYNQAEPAYDGFIDNITTLDGKTRMWANKPGGWDGSYFDIRTDYNYKIDLSNKQALRKIDDFDYGTVLAAGTLTAEESKTETETKVVTETVVKNNPLHTGIIIGVGAVAGAALAVVLGLVIGKAGKVK